MSRQIATSPPAGSRTLRYGFPLDHYDSKTVLPDDAAGDRSSPADTAAAARSVVRARPWARSAALFDLTRTMAAPVPSRTWRGGPMQADVLRRCRSAMWGSAPCAVQRRAEVGAREPERAGRWGRRGGGRVTADAGPALPRRSQPAPCRPGAGEDLGEPTFMIIFRIDGGLRLGQVIGRPGVRVSDVPWWWVVRLAYLSGEQWRADLGSRSKASGELS